MRAAVILGLMALVGCGGPPTVSATVKADQDGGRVENAAVNFGGLTIGVNP